MDTFIDVEGRKHVCSLCKLSFAKKSSLDGHLLMRHGLKSHVCDTCQTSLFLKRRPLKHTGDDNHTCNVCGKTFARKASLDYHAMTHGKETAYVCNICNSAFPLVSSLKVHTVLCSYDKYFSVPSVNLLENDPDPSTRTQSVSTTLSKLLVPQHQLVQTGEKPAKRHVCDVCKKAFFSSYGLNQHYVFNHAKHVCDICQKGFFSKIKLLKHSIVHRGGKRYVCDFCKKFFYDEAELQRHLLTHPEETLASAMNSLALFKTSGKTFPLP